MLGSADMEFHGACCSSKFSSGPTTSTRLERLGAALRRKTSVIVLAVRGCGGQRLLVGVPPEPADHWG